MNKKEKVMTFAIALADVFKDEEDRELHCMQPIKINEDGDVTEEIYCMFLALKTICKTFLDNTDMDNLDFISLLTRLVFQFGKKEQEE